MPVSSISSANTRTQSELEEIRSKALAFLKGNGQLAEKELKVLQRQFSAQGKQLPESLDILLKNFSAIDTDKDGSVTAAQLEAYRKANPAAAKSAAKEVRTNGVALRDLSKSDLLNLKDRIESVGGKLPKGLQKLIDDFDRTDKDRDGKISGKEFAEFAKANEVTFNFGQMKRAASAAYGQQRASQALGRYTAAYDGSVDMNSYLSFLNNVKV